MRCLIIKTIIHKINFLMQFGISMHYEALGFLNISSPALGFLNLSSQVGFSVRLSV